MVYEYITMTEKYGGNGLFDEDEGLPFKPDVIKNVGGHRIAVIGQAFPRTSNANPQKYFFPDWSFDLREDEMSENRKTQCVVRKIKIYRVIRRGGNIGLS